MMRMFKAKLGLLGLAGVVSVFAVASSAASAAIKFEWKVGGEILKAGESKEFTVTADGHTFDINGSAAGVTILLLTSEIGVEPGAKFIGGKPGTNEEITIFKNVTVDKPTKCAVESEGSTPGTVKSTLLKAEIVESDTTHEPLLLFQPKVGTAFVNILFLNKGTEECAIKGVLATVTGNFLGEPLPALTESVNGHVVFGNSTRTFVLSNGTLEEAGLVFAGNVATFTGLALGLLTSGQAYGTF